MILLFLETHINFDESGKNRLLSYINKRLFFCLIIIFFAVKTAPAQFFQLNNPLSEPLLTNPAYNGAYECSQIRINYKKYFSHHISTVSFSAQSERYKSTGSVLIYNVLQGNAVNSLSAKLIYTKEIQVNYRNYLHLAFETSYNQENIHTENLIFRHTADPVTGEYENMEYHYSFPPEYYADFAAGILFINPSIRAGIALHNISSLYADRAKYQKTKQLSAHIGKSFRLQKSDRAEPQNVLFPEIFIQYTDYGFNFAYGAAYHSRHLSFEFFLKHNQALQTVKPASSVRLHYKSASFGYSYELVISKYIMQPVSSHQIHLSYKLKCDSKRNKKNTIFCTSF